jgi:hypothetical protein
LDENLWHRYNTAESDKWLISWGMGAIAALPDGQRSAIETLKVAAMTNIEAAPAAGASSAPPTTYHFSRLCFRRDAIERIGQHAPLGAATSLPAGGMDICHDGPKAMKKASLITDGSCLVIPVLEGGPASCDSAQ